MAKITDIKYMIRCSSNDERKELRKGIKRLSGLYNMRISKMLIIIMGKEEQKNNASFK
jgi:hypothetical protein